MTNQTPKRRDYKAGPDLWPEYSASGPPSIDGGQDLSQNGRIKIPVEAKNIRAWQMAGVPDEPPAKKRLRFYFSLMRAGNPLSLTLEPAI